MSLNRDAIKGVEIFVSHEKYTRGARFGFYALELFEKLKSRPDTYEAVFVHEMAPGILQLQGSMELRR